MANLLLGFLATYTPQTGIKWESVEKTDYHNAVLLMLGFKHVGPVLFLSKPSGAGEGPVWFAEGTRLNLHVPSSA